VFECTRISKSFSPRGQPPLHTDLLADKIGGSEGYPKC
jgi:hypothetical protein